MEKTINTREKSITKLLVPSILLSDIEIENLIKANTRKTYTKVLKCDVFHVKEDLFDKIIKLSDNTGQNRALALRIVSKALSIKRSTPEAKMAMLAVASGLSGSYPSEADRIVRAV